MTPRPGTLVCCSLQICHRYDLGTFALPGDFSCDHADRCPVLHPPPPPAWWRRRWVQVCALSALLLVLTPVALISQAAALAAKKPRIVALSCSEAVPGEPWQAFVQTRGQEPFTYQWYEGYTGDTSEPVPGATLARYQTNHPGERSVFWVRVTNRYGSADSVHHVANPGAKIDYARELSELFRDVRRLLEQTDSIGILDRQLDETHTPLASGERETYKGLRAVARQKQKEAAAGLVKKLAYLRTLDRKAVTRTMEEYQRAAVPGIEGERRRKTFSAVSAHWNQTLEGRFLSEQEVIEDAQRYLPL